MIKRRVKVFFTYEVDARDDGELEKALECICDRPSCFGGSLNLFSYDMVGKGCILEVARTFAPDPKPTGEAK